MNFQATSSTGANLLAWAGEGKRLYSLHLTLQQDSTHFLVYLHLDILSHHCVNIRNFSSPPTGIPVGDAESLEGEPPSSDKGTKAHVNTLLGYFRRNLLGAIF